MLSGAGTAIENARLHSNVRRVTILEERERIGMDLHDGIIQSIYGVGLALENARAVLREDPESADNRLLKAMDDLNRTIRDIRNYILDLRPRQLRGESLIEGLGRLVAEFRQNTKLEVILAGPKEPLVRPAAGKCNGFIPHLPGSPGEYRQARQCQQGHD